MYSCYQEVPIFAASFLAIIEEEKKMKQPVSYELCKTKPHQLLRCPQYQDESGIAFQGLLWQRRG